MKRTAALLLAFAILLTMCACGAGNDGNTFLARITRTDGTTLTVTPELMSREHKTSDSFEVIITGANITDADGNAVGANMLSIGQEAFITYDGHITEGTPPSITASVVKLSGTVLENPTATDTDTKTITFTVNGEPEVVQADRVSLEGFSILVPSQGWMAQAAEDTRTGPVQIGPKDVPDVTMTFQVLTMTDSAAARDTLSKRYPGLVWGSWEDAPQADASAEGTSQTDSACTAVFVVTSGENTAAIACSYPAKAAESYGVRLAQIAATLKIG